MLLYKVAIKPMGKQRLIKTPKTVHIISRMV